MGKKNFIKVLNSGEVTLKKLREISVFAERLLSKEEEGSIMYLTLAPLENSNSFTILAKFKNDGGDITVEVNESKLKEFGIQVSEEGRRMILEIDYSVRDKMADQYVDSLMRNIKPNHGVNDMLKQQFSAFYIRTAYKKGWEDALKTEVEENE